MRSRWAPPVAVLVTVGAAGRSALWLLGPPASVAEPAALPGAADLAAKGSPARAAIPRPTRARPPAAGRAPRAPSPAAPAAPEAVSTTVGAHAARAEGDPEAEDTAAERGGVDPTLRLDAQGLSTVAERMSPSITACVEAWTAEDPEIEGHVVLSFQLGPEGVQEAWVSEHATVPVGVLGCFSAAVYEQDWPAAPGGVEVTLPFDITADEDEAEEGAGEEAEAEGAAEAGGGMIDRRGEAAPP
jgi:hypothetical protein